MLIFGFTPSPTPNAIFRSSECKKQLIELQWVLDPINYQTTMIKTATQCYRPAGLCLHCTAGTVEGSLWSIPCQNHSRKRHDALHQFRRSAHSKDRLNPASHIKFRKQMFYVIVKIMGGGAQGKVCFDGIQIGFRKTMPGEQANWNILKGWMTDSLGSQRGLPLLGYQQHLGFL